MQTVKRALLLIARGLGVVYGVAFALAGLGGIIATFTEKQPAFILLAVLLWVLAFLLLRVSTKKKQKKTRGFTKPSIARDMQITPELGVRIETQYIPEVPEETLRDMRKYYTAMQASNDARILSESFQLCQQTTNFDTFSSRLELSQQKIFTLLQAHKAGCRGIQPGTVETCNSILEAIPSLKIDYLSRIYIKETNAALLLKTPSGQRRRLEALLEELQNKETFFMDVEEAYKKILEKIKVLMP